MVIFNEQKQQQQQLYSTTNTTTTKQTTTTLFNFYIYNLQDCLLPLLVTKLIEPLCFIPGKTKY